MEKTSFPLPKTGEEFLVMVKSQHREIKALEDEKREYWESVSAISSPDYEHERVDGGQARGMPEKLIKLEEYGLLIDRQYNKLMDMKIYATELINEITNSEYRAFLREYYLLSHSIRAIAKESMMSKSTVWERLQPAVIEFNRVYNRRKKDKTDTKVQKKVLL
jgi:hypothetical protein